MSRKGLEGLAGLGLESDTTTYEAGASWEEELALAEELFSDDLPDRLDKICRKAMGGPTYEGAPPLPPMQGQMDKAVNLLTPHLLATLEGEFSTNVFLDCICRKVEEWRPEAYGSQAFMLNPLIQALYNLGFNDFIVDLTLFHTPLSRIGEYLHGVGEHRLRVSYLGKTIGGVGGKSRSCEFTLSPTSMIGNSTRSCKYYLESTKPLYDWAKSRFNNRTGEISDLWMPSWCRYSVKETVDKHLDFLRQSGLFGTFSGNTLYVPDNKGNWKRRWRLK